MLPFLKKNQKSVAGLIVHNRTPDEKQPDENTSESGDERIEACAQDLITAIHAHNVKDAAAAMRAAFEIMESEPHEENNDFHSRNEAAASERED